MPKHMTGSPGERPQTARDAVCASALVLVLLLIGLPFSKALGSMSGLARRGNVLLEVRLVVHAIAFITLVVLVWWFWGQERAALVWLVLAAVFILIRVPFPYMLLGNLVRPGYHAYEEGAAPVLWVLIHGVGFLTCIGVYTHASRGAGALCAVAWTLASMELVSLASFHHALVIH